MESVWSVSKLSTESVGSRRELVANSVHTADADATKQFSRVGVGGVYWASCNTKHQQQLFPAVWLTISTPCGSRPTNERTNQPANKLECSLCTIVVINVYERFSLFFYKKLVFNFLFSNVFYLKKNAEQSV